MTRLTVNFARDVVPSRAPRVAVHPTSREASQRSTVEALLLALVWLTFASSGVVFSEPAPVDALALLLIVTLPMFGLTTITPALMLFVAGWLVCAAAGTFAATQAQDVSRASLHTAVSLYLYMFAFVVAGFIARRPREHSDLILSGTTVAAVVAALAGIAGYLHAFPGAVDLFTRLGRAAGTFKDADVLGPFLVPAVLYLLHLALDRPLGKAMTAVGLAAVLSAAVVLSFSPGAWFNLAFAVGLFVLLTFVTGPAQSTSGRLVGLGGAGAILLAVAVAATQLPGVAAREGVHSVYLAMVRDAGWVGATAYLALVLATVILGARRLAQPFAARSLLIVCFAAFVASALQGAVVDTGHWRHFYLLMAMVWGLLPVTGRDDAERGATG